MRYGQRRHAHALIRWTRTTVAVGAAGRFLTGHDGLRYQCGKHEVDRDPPHNRSCPGVRGLATEATRYSPLAIAGQAASGRVTERGQLPLERSLCQRKHRTQIKCGVAGGPATRPAPPSSTTTPATTPQPSAARPGHPGSIVKTRITPSSAYFNVGQQAQRHDQSRSYRVRPGDHQRGHGEADGRDRHAGAPHRPPPSRPARNPTDAAQIITAPRPRSGTAGARPASAGRPAAAAGPAAARRRRGA